MKFAVLGDIHSNVLALKAVLDDLLAQKIQRIFCVGDLVGYGPRPNETIDLIRRKRVKTILGNCDDAAAFNSHLCDTNYASDQERRQGQLSLTWTKKTLTPRNKTFLRRLPAEMLFLIGDYKIFMFHASPMSLTEPIYYDTDTEILESMVRTHQADIYFFGHTHIPFIKRVSEKLFINVGSVGFPKDGNPDACYVTVDLTKEPDVKFHRVPYLITQTASEIIKAGLPENYAQTVKTGRPVTAPD